MLAAVTPHLSRILINGELRDTLSVLDRGLQYGDGLFETIRVVDGGGQYWGEHMDRLESGCRKLGIRFPNREVLRKDVDTLVQSFPKGVLKIIVTRGVSERGFRSNTVHLPNRVVLMASQPQYPAQYYQEGVELVLCKQRLLSLRDSVIPPTINLDNQDPDCDLDYVPNVARQAPVNVAMSNSFGFGGTNGTLIFKKL